MALQNTEESVADVRPSIPRTYVGSLRLYGFGHTQPIPEFHVLVKAITKARAEVLLKAVGMRVTKNDLGGWLPTDNRAELAITSDKEEGVWLREQHNRALPYVEAQPKVRR